MLPRRADGEALVRIDTIHIEQQETGGERLEPRRLGERGIQDARPIARGKRADEVLRKARTAAERVRQFDG